jgi:hypothetical protein
MLVALRNVCFWGHRANLRECQAHLTANYELPVEVTPAWKNRERVTPNAPLIPNSCVSHQIRPDIKYLPMQRAFTISARGNSGDVRGLDRHVFRVAR